jgi:hypothetical protein
MTLGPYDTVPIHHAAGDIAGVQALQNARRAFSARFGDLLQDVSQVGVATLYISDVS